MQEKTLLKQKHRTSNIHSGEVGHTWIGITYPNQNEINIGWEVSVLVLVLLQKENLQT